MANNISTKTWNQMGNLMFYKELNPFYFYFDYLINDYSKRSKKYNELAKSIGKAAQERYKQTVEQLFSNKQSDKEEINRLEMIPIFLKTAIQQEQENELAFFQQKYEQFKTAFKPDEMNSLPELTFLFNFFKNPLNQEGEIDYERFLITINTLIQGYDNAKSIIKYEKERLQDLEKMFTKAIESAGNRAHGLAYHKQLSEKEQEEWREKAESKHARKIEVHYLKEKNFSNQVTIKGLGLKKRLDKIKNTVDVEVAEWITQSLQNLLDQPQIRNQVTAIILNNQNLVFNNPQQLANYIKSFLVKNVTAYGVRNIANIIEKKISSQDTDNIMQNINKNFSYNFNIEGFFDNFGQYGIQLDYFRKANKLNKDGTKSAAQLYEALEKLRYLINKSKQTKSRIKLTPEQKYVANIFLKDPELMNIMGIITAIEQQTNEVNKKAQAAREINKKKEDLSLRLTTYQGASNQLPTTANITINPDGTIDISALNKIYGKYLSQLGFGKERINATSLERLVQGLKARASVKIRNKLDEIITGKVTKKSKKFVSQQQINQALQDGLEGITIFISAPKLSEITQGLQLYHDNDNISLIWTGPHNTKNDFVTVTVKTPIAEIKMNLSNILNIGFEEIDVQLEKQIIQGKEEVAKSLGTALAHNANKFADMKQYNNQKGLIKEYQQHEQEYFELAEKTNELLKNMPNVESLLQRIEQANVGASPEQIIEKKKKLLQLLTDFFYESSTMKTFNHYVNNIGFVGGGLGGNISQQINKIEEMFQAAGISLGTNKDWLIGAIINCSSHSVIQYNYQTPIEQYLGTIAVFTMFDEGGVEETILKNVQVQNSPKFLHLYRLNGIYYLGSYVLTKILTQFENYIQKINEVNQMFTGEHGGAAILGGGLSPKDIPNKGIISPSKAPYFDTNPWETVSNKAKGRASIQVVFLAGLLQTLEELEAAINNIEYPK